MTKLLLEEEQRDYVVLLAENRPQARIAFDGMVAMVRADEELVRRFEIVDHRHTLRYPATQSRAEAVAADVASLVGFNPSLAVVDELHLLGRTPKGAKLVNQVRTGNVARREPLLVLDIDRAAGADARHIPVDPGEGAPGHSRRGNRPEVFRVVVRDPGAPGPGRPGKLALVKPEPRLHGRSGAADRKPGERHFRPRGAARLQ